jgi:hypothetical protein
VDKIWINKTPVVITLEESSSPIIKPNVMVEWLTLLLRIHVWGSNLGPETSYPE